jgi:REP element-mobilizing transposase RayT
MVKLRLGWTGAYFITICTQNRKHFFGEIKNGKMILSPCRVLADVFWHETKNHANRLGLENGWQSRFHAHIIRNDAEYQRMNDYIEDNPQN